MFYIYADSHITRQALTTQRLLKSVYTLQSVVQPAGRIVLTFHIINK